MSRTNPLTSQRNNSLRMHLIVWSAAVAFVFAAAGLPIPSAKAQTLPDTNAFRIGERLTYNVSIGSLSNAAYG